MTVSRNVKQLLTLLAMKEVDILTPWYDSIERGVIFRYFYLAEMVVSRVRFSGCNCAHV